MTREYLKKAKLTSSSDASDVRQTVQTILDEIEAGGDAKALEYGAKFDNYTGPVLLSEADIAAAAAKVPQKLKDDIAFAHDNVRRFAASPLRRFAASPKRKKQPLQTCRWRLRPA